MRMKIKLNNSGWIVLGLLFLMGLGISVTTITDTYIQQGDGRKLTPLSTCTVSKDGYGDYTTITGCLNSLTSGGVIYVKEGNYTGETFPLVINSSVKLIGSGINKTIIFMPSNTNTHAFQNRVYSLGLGAGNYNDYIELSGFTIDANGDQQGSTNHGGIAFYGVRNSIIKDIEIKNTYGRPFGMNTVNSDNTYNLTNNLIEHIIITRTNTTSTQDAMALSGLVDSTIKDITITNRRGSGLTTASMKRVHISNVRITSDNTAITGRGLSFEDYGDPDVEDVYVEDVTTNNFGATAFYFQRANNITCVNCKVYNVSSASDGFYIATNNSVYYNLQVYGTQGTALDIKANADNNRFIGGEIQGATTFSDLGTNNFFINLKSGSSYINKFLGTTRPTATEGNCYWNNTASYHCLQCYNSTDWICGTDRV